MTPTEIADALETLAAKPYDAGEFPYDFAAATGNAPATVSKLRPGQRSLNKSRLRGGVLMNRKFHFAPAETGEAEGVLEPLTGVRAWMTLRMHCVLRLSCLLMHTSHNIPLHVCMHVRAALLMTSTNESATARV